MAVTCAYNLIEVLVNSYLYVQRLLHKRSPCRNIKQPEYRPVVGGGSGGASAARPRKDGVNVIANGRLANIAENYVAPRGKDNSFWQTSVHCCGECANLCSLSSALAAADALNCVLCKLRLVRCSTFVLHD